VTVSEHPAGQTPPLPPEFLFGASTAPHQVEGNNVNSDWWQLEHAPGTFVSEPSGDAADSYHRWREDMDLLSDLGSNAYRFGIEWARIEPAPGLFSRAAIAHYRRMVEGALERGLRPVVTLQHFTVPQWFAARGGWLAPDSAELFARYVAATAPVIGSGASHVVTINEPNITALMALRQAGDTDVAIGGPGLPEPHEPTGQALARAHRSAYEAVKAIRPEIAVGWTVANQVYQALPGAEAETAAYAWPREDYYLTESRADDWVGVQSYTRTRISTEGPLPVPEGAESTLTGWEFYPPALGEAVRHTAEVVGPDVPVIVTENGIATDDDERRVAYTTGALQGLAAAMADGVDVRGYLHWSALDNYEWGSYRPTFGLVGFDPDTFERQPKPSARWLGALARSRRLPV
jgi:beta-glucosidase